jgi:hypothetical protein
MLPRVIKSIESHAFLKPSKSKPNAKVTTSNNLFLYRSNITKNDHKPWKGLVTKKSHIKYLSPGRYYSKVITKVKVSNIKVKHQGQIF